MLTTTITPYTEQMQQQVTDAALGWKAVPMPTTQEEAECLLLKLALTNYAQYEAVKLVLKSDLFVRRYPPEIRLMRLALDLIEKGDRNASHVHDGVGGDEPQSADGHGQPRVL